MLESEFAEEPEEELNKSLLKPLLNQLKENSNQLLINPLKENYKDSLADKDAIEVKKLTIAEAIRDAALTKTEFFKEATIDQGAMVTADIETEAAMLGLES